MPRSTAGLPNPVMAGNIFGIAAYGAAAGDPVGIAITGVFRMPKANAAVLIVGARISWDDAAKKVDAPGTGRFPIDVAVEDAGNGVTTVAVRLDGVATVAA